MQNLNCWNALQELFKKLGEILPKKLNEVFYIWTRFSSNYKSLSDDLQKGKYKLHVTILKYSQEVIEFCSKTNKHCDIIINSLKNVWRGCRFDETLARPSREAIKSLSKEFDDLVIKGDTIIASITITRVDIRINLLDQRLNFYDPMSLLKTGGYCGLAMAVGVTLPTIFLGVTIYTIYAAKLTNQAEVYKRIVQATDDDLLVMKTELDKLVAQLKTSKIRIDDSIKKLMEPIPTDISYNASARGHVREIIGAAMHIKRILNDDIKKIAKGQKESTEALISSQYSNLVLQLPC